MTTTYCDRLIERHTTTGRPVRVGVVGTGQMGIGVLRQLQRMPGVEIAAVARKKHHCLPEALSAAGIEDAVLGDDLDKLTRVVDDGRPAAVVDPMMVPELPLDVVVDATGEPAFGAELAIRALLRRRHVCSLNVEADVTVGRLLAEVAARVNTVYTLCRGDEPAEALKLVEFARDLALEVVCAGKGKNNPMRPHTTAADVAAEAARKRMNPRMLASFHDGSKTQIEMAALANAADLSVTQRGMHGPPTTRDALATTFVPTSAGGILNRSGVVDFALAPHGADKADAVAPGVFVVVRSDDPVVVDTLQYVSMGPGPYYALYRPYHLTSVEVPLSIYAAVLDGASDIAPRAWRADVAAGTKRPLRAGETVDGIGGNCVYGVIESAEAARTERLVPLGLLDGARVVRDLPPDHVLTDDDVEIDTGTTIAHLRGLQDALLRGDPASAVIARIGATAAA